MPRISEIVLQEVPDAQFVLGGVGELEKLEKLVNMNHFKFLGWIEGEEKGMARESKGVFSAIIFRSYANVNFRSNGIRVACCCF